MESQRSGAFSFSARAASGAWVAMMYRRSACSWAGSPLPGGTPTMTTWRISASGHGAQAGFLLRFPDRDCERVGLAWVAVAADLEPGLLTLVPAEQHPGGGRMHDQRGGGDVQRHVTPPWVGGVFGKCPQALEVGDLGVAGRAVGVEEDSQARPGGR